MLWKTIIKYFPNFIAFGYFSRHYHSNMQKSADVRYAIMKIRNWFLIFFFSSLRLFPSDSTLLSFCMRNRITTQQRISRYVYKIALIRAHVHYKRIVCEQTITASATTTSELTPTKMQNARFFEYLDSGSTSPRINCIDTAILYMVAMMRRPSAVLNTLAKLSDTFSTSAGV